MDGRMLHGKVTQSGGGVGRNMADALGKLGTHTLLISAIGDDDFGVQISEKTISHLSKVGLVKFREVSTATCHVICDHLGECRVLVGDMGIHEKITPKLLQTYEKIILSSSLLVMDGNLSKESISYLLQLCDANNLPVWFEPTDIIHATKVFSASADYAPKFISPNYHELQEIMKLFDPSKVYKASSSHDHTIDQCISQAKSLVSLVDNIIVTLGKRGVLICRKGQKNDAFFDKTLTGKLKYCSNKDGISCALYSPEEVLHSEIVNVSGAGDCFASGFIAAMLKGKGELACVRHGFMCSSASLRSSTTVPKSFEKSGF